MKAFTKKHRALKVIKSDRLVFESAQTRFFGLDPVFWCMLGHFCRTYVLSIHLGPLLWGGWASAWQKRNVPWKDSSSMYSNHIQESTSTQVIKTCLARYGVIPNPVEVLFYISAQYFTSKKGIFSQQIYLQDKRNGSSTGQVFRCQ